MGTAILVGQHGSAWHVAEVEISSAYRAFSREKVMGTLGVHIGLNSVNVTLKAMPIYNQSSDIDYNERFHWVGATQMKEDYIAALQKGLPFPILTVGEYFTVDAEGFCWGRNYREAGYYTSIFLWMAFALWVLSNLLLIVVPRYGANLMTLTGVTLLFCNLIYYRLLPSRPLIIRLEQSTIEFSFGWSFWLVLVAGCLCVLMGGAVSIIDLIYPHKFSTILEVDFGTPFDRHTIIEDSQETKKKKKIVPKLEEPAGAGLGSRLLRRLSKRDREGRSTHPDGGVDNYAYEMEAPKSPWRYPHLMFRADSRKQKSVSFRNSHGRNQLELPGISGFGEFAKHLRRTDSKDSSCSSLSSAPQVNSLFFIKDSLSELEIVSKLQLFTDGRPRPPSNVIWPLGCLPRPLQQVQEDRLRVKRGQSRLHGLVHPEQGRQQKGRQKCELPKRSQKILRAESFSRTKPGRFGPAMDLICSASGWRVRRTSESSDGARRVRFKLCLLSCQVVPDPEIVWDSCQPPPLFAKI